MLLAWELAVSGLRINRRTDVLPPRRYRPRLAGWTDPGHVHGARPAGGRPPGGTGRASKWGTDPADGGGYGPDTAGANPRSRSCRRLAPVPRDQAAEARARARPRPARCGNGFHRAVDCLTGTADVARRRAPA